MASRRVQEATLVGIGAYGLMLVVLSVLILFDPWNTRKPRVKKEKPRLRLVEDGKA